MADYSIALGVQNPQINVGNVLSLASQMQRNKLAEQQSMHGMRNDDARLKLSQDQAEQNRRVAAAGLAAKQEQKNALAAYSTADQAGDPNSLQKLSAYPEMQSKVLQVRSQMAEGDRAAFDQRLLRNAKRAQYVGGLSGDAKNQAWQQSMKEALDAGDISPQIYEQYSAAAPNDLLLQNVISQAAPIEQLYKQNEPTNKMRELEAAGIERGTPEYKQAIAPSALPRFEKVGNRLIRINPDSSTADLTPPGVQAKSEKPPSGYRFADDGESLEAIPGGPADPATKVREAKFSEGASKAANFANMMQSAEGELETITENPIGFFGTIRETLPEGVANVSRSPEYQRYRQAAMQWVRAKLRKESGAAISSGEFEGEFQTYFPQYGDDPEVIKQKNEARQQAIRGMKAESRGAYDEFFGQTASAVPPASEATIDAPREAVQFLLSDPSPEAQREFDEVFGEGAAQQVLGRE